LSELEDKLSGILNSPEQMARIMQLAQSLSGEKDGEKKSEEPPRREKEAASSPFEGLDPKMIALLSRLTAEFSSSSSGGKEQLIAAIKPYLSRERGEKIDRAAKIARLAKIAQAALREMGGDPFV